MRTAAMRGLPALFVTVEEFLPLSPATTDEALVLVNLWGRMASNPAISASPDPQECVRRERMLQHLNEAIHDGDLQASAPVEDIADGMLAICLGMQVQHVVRHARQGTSHQLRIACTPLTPWLAREPDAAGKQRNL